MNETEPDSINQTKKQGVPVAVVAIIIALTALIAVIITLFVSTYVRQNNNSTLSKINDKLVALDNTIRGQYIKDIDENKLIDSVLKGYMNGLGDNYAEYYNEDEYKMIMSDLSGKGEGFGISIVYNSEYKAIEVISVFPNSPALEAGIMAGDLIAYVGVGDTAESIADIGYSAAITKLRGEAGTQAQFVVFRGDDYSERLEFSVTRGYYTETTVYSHLYEPDNSIGVIKITSFAAATPDQFIKSVDELIQNGARGIILDVRYNPGGELMSVCKCLDYLLPEGTVIRTVDKAGNEEVVYTSDANEINIPMTVLVNGNTASAGELFTAALKDYNKATIVGTTTYGKGSMQTTNSFGDGTGFKFTYRYYCPPFSDNYDGIGITPDVTVELDEALQNKNIYKITDSEDNQLATAYSELLKLFNK